MQKMGGNVVLGVKQLRRRWYDHMFFKNLVMLQDHAEQKVANFETYVRKFT